MAAPDENGWLPIETAPRDGTKVMVSGFNFDTPAEGRWITAAEYYSEQWVGGDGAGLYPPTHWQPLPQPPVGA